MAVVAWPAVLMCASPVTAADDLQSWHGVWQGRVQQGQAQYGVEMLVRSADAEGAVGYTHYPEPRCIGVLTREATPTDQVASFRESIVQGAHCISGGRITLERSGADMRWNWHNAGGRLLASGTVARGTPSATLARLAGQEPTETTASRPPQPNARTPEAGITSLEGFHAVSVGRDLGAMHSAWLRFVVRGGHATTGIAYELHGVASSDPNDRLSIGRAAFRGRWWPDTQQFEEENGFPAPHCTYWQYRGWTSQLAPAAVDLGSRTVRVWRHTGESPAHRKAATGRSCKALEIDRACRREVRCHRWHAVDDNGAFVLVDNEADARALFEHARARGGLQFVAATPTSPAPAGTAPSRAAAPTTAVTVPGAPHDDPKFIAGCQAHALMEAVALQPPAGAADAQDALLREHWPRRLQELVPDPAERQAIARSAAQEVLAMARPLSGEHATQASVNLLRSRLAAVRMRCLLAIPVDHPIQRRLQR